MKRIAICMLLLSITFLTSCHDIYVYNENNPELQVIATNSLLAVQGGESDEVIIIEQDQYGRTLFAYESELIDSYVLAVLVAQKCTNEKAYYYDNSNFILCQIGETAYTKPLNTNLIKEYFADDQIQKLKEENDWSCELKEDKFFEVTVQRKKEDIIPSNKQEQAYEDIMGTEDLDTAFSIPLTSDKNGITIYFMMQDNFDYKTETYYRGKPYLVMFDHNGEVIQDTGTKEIKDMWNYMDELKEFKEANGWSFYSK